MTFEVEIIEKKIEETIEKYNMLDNTSSVIVGVSGGADSMALLKFFEKHTKKYNLKLIAAHINHCLRDEESDRDENFVKEYCQKNDIILKILKLDVKKIAKETKKGIEECARRLRYNFFNELSEQYDGKIATAHTLTDSVETMLINFVRGTGVAGLCGIPAKRGNIIRPLISIKRAETQNYCKEHEIFYVTDSTNLSCDYTRNKIRLNVFPVLKQINPEFELAAQRTASILKADEEYLNEIVKKIINENTISNGVYNLKEIKFQRISILSRFVRIIVSEFLQYNVTARHIDLILDLIKNNNGAVVLPQNVKVNVKNNVLFIEKFEKKLTTLIKKEIDVPFNVDSVLTVNSEKFIIKVLEKSELDLLDNIHSFYVMDYDKINTDSRFRTRKAGDKFCPAGRGITKSIKKLFNEIKIPLAERDKILMLAYENEVFWINSIGISENVKVDKNTKKIVAIYSESEINS